MSLFAKTLLVVVALFVLIAATVSMLSARLLYRSLTEEYRNTGVAIVRSLVDAGTETLLNRDLATVQAAVDQFDEVDGVAYVFLTDADGDIVSHTFVPQVPSGIRALVGQTHGRKVSDEIRSVHLDLENIGQVMDVYAPILGGIAGFAHVGMDLEFIRAQIRRAVGQQQLLFTGIFLLATVLAFFLTRRVARPVSQLAHYTRHLSEQDFSSDVEIPEEIQALAARSRDEMGQLAGAFVDMEHTLHRYLEDLQATTAAKERIESELGIAHDIQMSLVPRTFPPFPERREFELHASLVPAREVGGDFYDFFFVDDRRLCIAIGDVSDKGVPASLFMALTRTLLRAIGREPGMGPAEIMSRLNEEIAAENEKCMFVTAFCAFLHIETGAFEYCNAGHNPPFVVRPAGPEELPGTRGVALGVAAGIPYTSAAIRLGPGDAVFLYTDGITEAMDPERTQFGAVRLAAILAENPGRGCRELIGCVAEGVGTFRRDAGQSDDMTMLALRYRGG